MEHASEYNVSLTEGRSAKIREGRKELAWKMPDEKTHEGFPCNRKMQQQRFYEKMESPGQQGVGPMADGCDKEVSEGEPDRFWWVYPD